MLSFPLSRAQDEATDSKTQANLIQLNRSRGLAPYLHSICFFVKVSNWSFHSSHIRLLAKFISTFMWVDPDSLFLTSFTHQLFITLALAGPLKGLPVAVVKNPPAVEESQETQVQSLGQKDPLEEAMATHSSILAWRIH